MHSSFVNPSPPIAPLKASARRRAPGCSHALRGARPSGAREREPSGGFRAEGGRGRGGLATVAPVRGARDRAAPPSFGGSGAAVADSWGALDRVRARGAARAATRVTGVVEGSNL